MDKKQKDIEDILLLDQASVQFEREKYYKETQEIQGYIKSMSSRALTSFDRQRLGDLEDIAAKKQLLNARQERYFDGLNELRAMKDSEILRGGIGKEKKAASIFYLVEERDNILEEKQRLRTALARIVEEEEPYQAQFARPNLLQNPLAKKALNPPTAPPTEAEVVQDKMKKMRNHFEIVDHIERIREGANNMANTDKKFLNSLNTVLTELKSDYFKPVKPARVGSNEDDDDDNGMRDSIDELEKRGGRDLMNKTRESGFSRHSASNSGSGQRLAAMLGPPGGNTYASANADLDFDLGPQDRLTQKKIQLMNIEKALGFDERIQELNFQRKNLDLDVITANSQLKYQDYLTKNYQDLMHEKNVLRKEITSEMEMIRKDKLEARKVGLEVRNARAELEMEKKKLFLERRAKEVQNTKKEMMNIVKNYMDYKSYAYDKAPFPPEIVMNKYNTNYEFPNGSAIDKGRKAKRKDYDRSDGDYDASDRD